MRENRNYVLTEYVLNENDCIYIANDESPSQHVTVGLAEARPNQAFSRAVVVNSNMSRGKYPAREGPGSRLLIRGR